MNIQRVQFDKNDQPIFEFVTIPKKVKEEHRIAMEKFFNEKKLNPHDLFKKSL